MTERKDKKLNWLQQKVPEGLLVTAAWLTKHGYSSSLRTQYVAAGWLEQPTRGVFRRPRGELRWEQVIISLQTVLLEMFESPIVVGGRTSLELQGYAHYLSHERTEIHLYGDQPAPSWLNKLGLPICFVFHSWSRLFSNDPTTRGLTSHSWNLRTHESVSRDPLHVGYRNLPWDAWDWPITLTTPERAILELLDELPDKESFHQADKLMEGLVNLSPRRLQKLLEDCHSIKVKRLFFFFADRHTHAWLKRIDRTPIDLGKGKRMLVRGGRLDAAYGITVPRELDAVE